MSITKPEMTIICDRCGKEEVATKHELESLFVPNFKEGYWTEVHPAFVNTESWYGKLHLCPRCSLIARKKVSAALNKTMGF